MWVEIDWRGDVVSLILLVSFRRQSMRIERKMSTGFISSCFSRTTSSLKHARIDGTSLRRLASLKPYLRDLQIRWTQHAE